MQGSADRPVNLARTRPPANPARLPRRAIYPLAFASEAIARFTGREPFATLDGLRMAKYRMFFTSAKAQSELGYTARPVIEALKDSIAWFRQAGLIR